MGSTEGEQRTLTWKTPCEQRYRYYDGRQETEQRMQHEDADTTPRRAS